ncbi:MAG: hypothetical protein E7310_01980 [Clostridiales bacterium]|nr:hypothetical protein [Clostridiales bacterium]
MKRLAAAIVAIAVLIALVTCFVKHITTTPETTTTATSSSTLSDDNVVGEVISSTIDELNFSAEQLSYMNLVYNPYTKEVGDGLIVFPKETIDGDFYTLYLFGIDDDKAIEVEGWHMIGKTKLDNGLIKLIVTDQGVDGVTVPEGTILLDGREIIHMC